MLDSATCSQMRLKIPRRKACRFDSGPGTTSSPFRNERAFFAPRSPVIHMQNHADPP